MKRLIVKVGTSTLTTTDGCLDRAYIASLCKVLAAQREAGQEVVLVTSAAVSAGVDRLKISRPATIPEKQAAAAIGQGILMGVYASCFEASGLNAAQILLTRQDVADRPGYTNARNTFKALFRYGAVPIVNENDSVAIDEIRFGDNDTLAAIVGLITDADLVILLSDVQGLYDPSEAGRPVIRTVREVTAAIEALAKPVGAGPGTGGMVTKLKAARMATRAGIPLAIGPGRDLNTIPGMVNRWKAMERGETDPGTPGTLFLPAERRIHGRKRWIAFGSRARGSLVVNEMARQALVHDGRSLLAAGIVDASGSFQIGDLVRVLDTEGHEVARGLVNYTTDEIRLIRGRHSQELSAILGRSTLAEVIHRDNLVTGY